MAHYNQPMSLPPYSLMTLVMRCLPHKMAVQGVQGVQPQVAQAQPLQLALLAKAQLSLAVQGEVVQAVAVAVGVRVMLLARVVQVPQVAMVLLAAMAQRVMFLFSGWDNGT